MRGGWDRAQGVLGAAFTSQGGQEGWGSKETTTQPRGTPGFGGNSFVWKKFPFFLLKFHFLGAEFPLFLVEIPFFGVEFPFFPWKCSFFPWKFLLSLEDILFFPGNSHFLAEISLFRGRIPLFFLGILLFLLEFPCFFQWNCPFFWWKFPFWSKFPFFFFNPTSLFLVQLPFLRAQIPSRNDGPGPFPLPRHRHVPGARGDNTAIGGPSQRPLPAAQLDTLLHTRP